MSYTIHAPHTAISAIYRKHNITESHYKNFCDKLAELQQKLNVHETEEHGKVPLRDFLKNTFYADLEINTKGDIDYAIFNGNTDKAPVAVLIEMKKLSEQKDMPTSENLGAKSFYQSVLYYLRERIDAQNNDLKHIVITNLQQWFVFDAMQYEKHFFTNTKLVREYNDWSTKQKTSSSTDLFYREIVPKYLPESIEFTYFSLADFDTTRPFDVLKEDKLLTALYKFFSPSHLLKRPFANDSNSLNKPFYYELLYILGLEERKEGGKKLIGRPAEGQRITGSMMENTITTLETRGRMEKLSDAYKYGDTPEEQMEAVALELNITWLNRILFLKLLEAQLLKYHNGNSQYHFLSYDKIREYDMLEELFFDVLAIREHDRNSYAQANYGFIPYLNSSLFEQTALESNVVSMSMLKDRYKIPLYKNTVLRDGEKRAEGEMPILQYLFAFLEAYDFASEGTEEVQKQSKELINASVLGLIFEKINGYKEGSFFTPGFITEYMSRETIRRTVVQKFKNEENNQIEDFEELKAYCHKFFKPADILRFNKIINSVKIVDPAVGSGHFLVSSLNELLAIKSELGLLADAKGMPLDYGVRVENDELVVIHLTKNHLFEYHLDAQGKTIPELQTVQETLFNEKRYIIENCLFGVDINPNSVHITHLRLWIELLKNAYYMIPDTTLSGVKTLTGLKLQTLPNIDINIKTGNSLISRFTLDTDIRKALRGTKWNLSMYLTAVNAYKEVSDKKSKDQIRQLIDDIKRNFRTVLSQNHPKYSKLAKLKRQFYDLFSGNMLFEDETQYGGNKTERQKQREQMEQEIAQLETELEEIKSNKLYYNAFEWRFEFPEVLHPETGEYLGFDVVIGNPPYVQLQSMKELSKKYAAIGYTTFTSTGDLYALFYERGLQVLKQDGLLAFISGSAWMRANYGANLRKFFLNNTHVLQLIDLSDTHVFDSATVLTSILIFRKTNHRGATAAIRFTKKDQEKLSQLAEIFRNEHIQVAQFLETSWIIENSNGIKQKVEQQGVKLVDWDIEINRGILTGFNEAFIIDRATRDRLIAEDPKSAEILKPLLRGRDIKKYAYDFQDKWLVNTHNGVKKLNIPIIDVRNYPAIKKHLENYWQDIERRTDQGDSPYNLRNCAYIKEFESPKIIYSELTKFLYFTFDSNYNYVDKTAFICTGRNLYFLVCFLNSKVFKYCFADNFSEIQGNTRVLSKIIFEQIPVKQIPEEAEAPFKEKVEAILSAKKANPQADTSALEAEIDQMVYALYGLSPAEIQMIEQSTL